MRKVVENWRVWLGFLVLIPSLLLNYYFWQKTEKTESGSLVVEVVDGDTFILENRQPIRLFGLDAPEIGNCYGEEAKDRLTTLILNKRVILKEPLADKTGRVMALVYLKDKLINEDLIRNGFALYNRQGESETEAMRNANNYAREKQLGIFSSECSQKEPPNKKCNIKGNIEDREKRKIYFLPDCANYDQVIIEKFLGEDWFCTEQEAKKAGFEKSKTCRGE